MTPTTPVPPRLAPAATVACLALAMLAAVPAGAAPRITRLTPPSELYASGTPAPVIARFLPGQRFDLQGTVQPDPGTTIVAWSFRVDGREVRGGERGEATTGLAAGLAAGSKVVSVRGVALDRPGVHVFTLRATQSDGASVEASGNLEVIGTVRGGRRVRNVIVLLGDGMGASQRTAARIVLGGYAQGKPRTPLAMDTFPVTALVRTASLNSIVTDSSPGMASYVTGSKQANNEEGVFPDDTTDPFDNPRIEYLGSYLRRTAGTALGVVTTADVFDATPASMAVHTADRRAGTGIVDQFFDERGTNGLRVLMGGGRKWFLPAEVPGSARSARTDYVLPPEQARAWGVAAGALDPRRDLIAEFRAAGWSYAATATELRAAPAGAPLLGLYAYSNMNVALDKIGGRRGRSDVVARYGLPDQPMLDEMAAKALEVLDREPRGFLLLVEGASIDKQAHAMDADRWVMDTVEFDRAVRVAKEYAARRDDTLVIVTADHECAGATIIGAATVSIAELRARAASGGGAAALRDVPRGAPRGTPGVVGTYEAAGFPRYAIAADGYPETTDVDRKMLIGYGANADRYEDWLADPRPLRDAQQPETLPVPPGGYPADFPEGPMARDLPGAFLVTGQVPDAVAAHSGTDVPLSAYGPGSSLLGGVIDNTDVHFAIGQAVLGGVRPRR